MELHKIIDTRNDLEAIAGILIRKGADFKVYTAPMGRGIVVDGDANVKALKDAYFATTGRWLDTRAG